MSAPAPALSADLSAVEAPPPLPYRHAIVPSLLPASLLSSARTEILNELRFTDRETDIFAYAQTGDLANLAGLDARQAKRLASVVRVRDALFSREVREWLQARLGCGPLSATKGDLSVLELRDGAHLLPHRETVGSSRRVVFYLDASGGGEGGDESKDKGQGGDIELYGREGDAVSAGASLSSLGAKLIPSRFNQFTAMSLFDGSRTRAHTHAIAEVPPDAPRRLFLAGWFHASDGGDDGKEKERDVCESDADAATRATSPPPFTAYPDSSDPPPLPGTPLSPSEIAFLQPWLNPAYLSPATQRQLFDRFGDESHVLLADVLHPDVAGVLRRGVQGWDRTGASASASAGEGEAEGAESASAWAVAGPPHQRRYLALKSNPEAAASALTPTSASQPPPTPTTTASSLPSSALGLLAHLQSTLLPSLAFRHFLANITQLVPLSHRSISARRFRPGSDYTAARAEADDAVLDVCLGLSVGPTRHAGGKKKRKRGGGGGGDHDDAVVDRADKWVNGEFGGADFYLAPNDDEGDEAAGPESDSHRRSHGRGRRRSQELADAAFAARERFDAEDEAEADEGQQKATQASTQRRNTKDFEWQYVSLDIRRNGGGGIEGTPLTDVQLHEAITRAVVALHGRVGGAFHFDVLRIGSESESEGKGNMKERERNGGDREGNGQDREGNGGDKKGNDDDKRNRSLRPPPPTSALLRVATPHVSLLTAAIAGTLSIPGCTVRVREQANAFTVNSGGAGGSEWMNALLDAPSGKRRRRGGDAGGDGEASSESGDDEAEDGEGKAEGEGVEGMGEGGDGDRDDAEDEEEDDDDDDGEDDDAEDGDEDDPSASPTLLTLPPSFNTLSVVLRDQGVMHFVKYLGTAAAGASRWDVVGEYGVGAVEIDDGEGEGGEDA